MIIRYFLFFILLTFTNSTIAFTVPNENASEANTLTPSIAASANSTITNTSIETENLTATAQNIDYSLYRLTNNNIHFFNFSQHKIYYNIKIEPINNNKFKLFVKGIFEDDTYFTNSYIEIILKNANDLQHFMNTISYLLDIKENMTININNKSINIMEFSYDTLLKVLFLSISNSNILDIAISRK